MISNGVINLIPDIAMVYLRSRGIQAKYLKDGLIGLAENLRGDDAKDFIEALDELRQGKHITK